MEIERNSPSRASFQFRGGFSIVELLVVIGIIGILISILLPTVGRAREQAKGVTCASNLRSIGQSINGYMVRYDGFYPPWKNGSVWQNPANTKQRIDPNDDTAYWGVHLAAAGGIGKESFHCPAERTRSGTGAGTDAALYIHYALNSYGGHNSSMSDAQRTALFGVPDTTAIHRRITGNIWLGRSRAEVKNPAQTIFAQDAYETVIDGNGDTFVNWYQWPGKEFEWLRHFDKANVVFADGHVEALTQAAQSQEKYYTGRW